MKLQEADMLLAGKYLLSCLMGAIDRGMGAKYGPEWFEAFKARENEERVPLITDEKCLEDLDIQACLKLFKFRSAYRDAVLAHFGFYDLGTEAEKKERRNTFTQAVTRLMDNYRNKYMHLRAGESFLFVPVVKDENTLGASAVFFSGQTSRADETLTDGEQQDKDTDAISNTQQGTNSRFRLFTFAYEDGELKVALEKIAAISKYIGDYPEGYNSAVAEGRNTYLADEADYSFKEETVVIPDSETAKCVLAWAEPDGSVSLLIRLANGASETAQYNSIHVNVMTGTGKATGVSDTHEYKTSETKETADTYDAYLNSLIYEGDVDLRRNGNPRVLPPGTGVNYIVNIKKDSLTEGAAVCKWGDLRVKVSYKPEL